MKKVSILTLGLMFCMATNSFAQTETESTESTETTLDPIMSALQTNLDNLNKIVEENESENREQQSAATAETNNNSNTSNEDNSIYKYQPPESTKLQGLINVPIPANSNQHAGNAN
ncbi:MAG: hypothetical protein ABIO81_11125 [Ginsengibacter sp.]